MEIISLFTSLKSGWLDASLILLVTASTISALSRQLPSQNVLAASIIIALAGGAISVVGEIFGNPFGSFLVGVESGPRIFGTAPWAMPLIWVTFILNSRGVARLILRPWRKTRTYGFRLIGITAVLTAFFEFAFEPFATFTKHFWFWEPTQLPVSWHGAPLVNFVSWAVITILILAFTTPLLINKQLSKRPAPDFYPLIIWSGAMILFGISAAVETLWSAVAVDIVIGIATAIFAIRGARW
ncbi:MAG TPA: carotenoid biosynthesis protein [Candidatus Baltobacteraceae bacterium]|nr:carotenoid biosynthesis protein [Candidatus Baltobacteraceae bacterium]